MKYLNISIITYNYYIELKNLKISIITYITNKYYIKLYKTEIFKYKYNNFYNLERLLSMLTEREMRVLELRAKKLTQIEVSKKLGISQAAVSHFETNALRKIREAKETLKIARKLRLK